MKKYIITLILMFMIIPITVSATGGGLRKNSLKTCPNGVTYGLHGDGNGGTHWHEAVTNGNNYYAKGDAIYSDPCPNSNTNEGTAGTTNDGLNNSSSNDNDNTSNNSSNSSGNPSNNSNGNNTNSNNTTTNKQQTTTTKPAEKSKDTTMKELFVDSTKIDINDEMTFETTKKNVEIKIELNDSKAKYNFENKELQNGENIFEISVTAEDGTTKNYNLVITKTTTKGTATIKKFILGAGEVDFKDNKATIQKLQNEEKLDYSYELSSSSATLKIYLNGKETTELTGLNENDKIKLVVIDENNNENEYEITVTNASILFSFIVYGLTALIMLSPVGIIITIIIFIKKKKSKK